VRFDARLAAAAFVWVVFPWTGAEICIKAAEDATNLGCIDNDMLRSFSARYELPCGKNKAKAGIRANELSF
jgi:hypothetical protein